MELRHLRAFVEVADAGSITAAGKVLRLTQPALSRQIRALEEELDVVLLERGAHSISLTPAGELLRTEARKLLSFSEAMAERVRAEASGEPLRVAYAPSLAGEFIALAIERFTQIHNRVRVSLSDRSSVEMHAGLTSGKFDLILAVPCPREAIDWTPLREYGWAVMLPANHALAEKERISPDDLHGQRLLMMDREQYPDYWNRVTRYFKDRSLQAKVAGEFDGRESLFSAVEAGLGLALIAQTGATSLPTRGRIVIKRLTEEPDPIVVAIGTQAERDCPDRIRAFIEELKRAAGED